MGFVSHSYAFKCVFYTQKLQLQSHDTGLTYSRNLLSMAMGGEESIHALDLICSAEPTWDYAVLAESPLYGLQNISNIWWMAPMKPYGLQISYNVIPLLVWFPSMTLCKEQSAAFSKT